MLGGLLLAVLVFFLRLPRAEPFEDAAMSMRYIDHLAAGHGFVWNVGEPPVDGATDFLFGVVAAAFVWMGAPVEATVQALGLVFHLATVALVFLTIRHVLGASLPAALVAATFLGFGVGLTYVGASFSTTFYAFWCTAAAAAACWIRDQPGASHASAAVFAVSGLLAGLSRPDGVFLAALLLVALLAHGRGRRAAVWFVAVFAVAGGAYFAWRWSLFGHPLPNPFYKKGGGALYLGSLRHSVLAVITRTLPFLPVLALAATGGERLRKAVFWLIPLAGFTAVWVLLSNEMNYNDRFQYAAVPIAMLAWPDIGKGFLAGQGWWPGPADRTARTAWTLLLVAGLLVVAVSQANSIAGSLTPAHDGRSDVGRMLAEYEGKGYTLATTEAGLVPFYSKWRTLDAWGLNDPEVARQGLTWEHLAEYDPTVIAIHMFGPPWGPPRNVTEWDRMAILLEEYAAENGYVLASSFALSFDDVHKYYVDPDAQDGEEIVRRIRGMSYASFVDGRPCVDYADHRVWPPASRDAAG